MQFSISLASIALAVSLGSSIAEAASCSALYGQCGGVGWSGPTCCVSGAKCVAQANNKYYSQCLPDSDSSSSNNSNNGGKKTTVKKHTSNKTKKSTKKDTSHPPKKTTTKKASRTTTAAPKPTGSSGSGSSGNSGYSVVPGGVSGPGQTTRYWDCCKPSCGWNGKAKVSAPVDSCAKNGITIVDDNVQSGCAGGNAFVCNNNQPWAVNDNLAYGFAAATLVGSSEGQWCCACYELTFTSSTVAGKKMVVQVTNTGSDLGSNSGNVAHFDLLMPGGGVGLFNGCQPQWNAPDSGWGARYGGISDASACNSLPSALQPGCKWRYTWFKNADNPNMTFKEVTCPAEIIQRSGCKRL